MSNSIYIDPGFETFLNRVFGKDRYHGIAGNHRKTSWKNILTKLFNSLKKHIEVNIQGDPDQIYELEKDLELIKSTLKRNESINDLNVSSIRILFNICFQLLGDEIDNTDKKIVNHHSHYELDWKRTLSYHSNNLQKFWKVHSRAGTGQFLDAGFPTKEELIDIFFEDMNGDASEFIDWFKMIIQNSIQK